MARDYIINMTNKNFSPVLEQFVDRLLEEKKLVGLDQEVLQQAKEDILTKAEERIKATIFANLPSDKLEKFNELMEASNEANLQAFIRQEIPNLEQLIATSLLEFRNTYLG